MPLLFWSEAVGRTAAEQEVCANSSHYGFHRLREVCRTFCNEVNLKLKAAEVVPLLGQISGSLKADDYSITVIIRLLLEETSNRWLRYFSHGVSRKLTYHENPLRNFV